MTTIQQSDQKNFWSSIKPGFRALWRKFRPKEAISIRRRMLFILLSAFFVVWFLATMFTIIYMRERIEAGLDDQLIQAANILHDRSLFAMDSEHSVQDALQDTRRFFGRLDSVAYQVWDGQSLVIQTENAPATRMINGPGHRDGVLNGRPWRFYYRVDAVQGLDVIVGVEDDFSGDLARIIAFRQTWPLLAALPFIGLLIVIGVRQGLRPVRDLASQITARSPSQLSPIDSKHVPEEVKGIVNSLNGLLARLDDAIEGERRFTANASHELRTPLAAIEVQSQVALKSQDPEERAQALRQISDSVDRATRLVAQLLTLARLDPESAGDLMTTVDLRRVVEDELAALAESALAKGLEISLDTDGPALVKGDPDGLSIMIRNLLDNAIRYTPQGGAVTATIDKTETGIRLVVSDTGPGIPESEQSNVFDRFYRMVGSTSSGAGLGLSIVRRIGELHQSELSLSEQPGGGLAVTALFPRSY